MVSSSTTKLKGGQPGGRRPAEDLKRRRYMGISRIQSPSHHIIFELKSSPRRFRSFIAHSAQDSTHFHERRELLISCHRIPRTKPLDKIHAYEHKVPPLRGNLRTKPLDKIHAEDHGSWPMRWSFLNRIPYRIWFATSHQEVETKIFALKSSELRFGSSHRLLHRCKPQCLHRCQSRRIIPPRTRRPLADGY